MTFKVISCVSWVFLGADAEMEGAGLIWGKGDNNGCQTEGAGNRTGQGEPQAAMRI